MSISLGIILSVNCYSKRIRMRVKKYNIKMLVSKSLRNLLYLKNFDTEKLLTKVFIVALSGQELLIDRQSKPESCFVLDSDEMKWSGMEVSTRSIF